MTTAAALLAEGHAATANMRPVEGARLLRAALAILDESPAIDDDSPAILDGSVATLDESADAELRGRVLANLAYAEAEQGHIDEGWRLLDQAALVMPPHARAMLHNQRALLHIRTGGDEAAIAEYGLSLALLREDTDAADLARALLNRGNLQLTRGRLREARADLDRCAEVSRAHDLDRILPLAEQGLGYLAHLAGDLPTALRTYRRVAEAYARVKPGLLPVLALDRARALTAAGLLAEADFQLAYALEQFRRHRLQQDHAEALLARAENALSAGDAPAARRWASAARRGFQRRANERWAAAASLVELRSQSPAGRSPAARRRLAAKARALAGTFTAVGLPEQAREAGLIAARAAAVSPAAHRPARTDRLETRLLWRLACAEHEPRNAARHLAAGLADLQRHRSRLGSLDLQTGAAVHGREIAAAGLALALRSGSARTVHRWSELGRAQALLLPPATPPADPVAAAALEELRQVRESLRVAELSGRPTAELSARAARLERTVREQSWTAAGAGPAERPASLESVRAALGGAALVAYLRDGPRLHALVVTDRTASVVALGEMAAAEEHVRRLRADLDAMAGRALPARLHQAITLATDRDARAVQAALLPDIGDRDLVVVPTGGLIAVPWGVLPACRGRPVTVAPSATTWLTARQRRATAAAGGVVLVAGPGIGHGEQEVRAIAALYPGSTVLTDAAADPAGTLAALAGASVAHLAAHGRHQPENPLFSSLDLAGGPLMGYDLTRIAAPPAVVVLAACDLGLADVRPGDEAIGMTTALLAAGTATVVAGVGRIADSAALPILTALHRELRSGRSPAVALARAGAAETPLVCFGAG